MSVYEPHYKTRDYIKFVKETGLEITPNMGYSTDIYEDQADWKDVSPITEIAILEYNELDYKAKPRKTKVIKMQQSKTTNRHIYKQTSLF